MAAQPQPMAVTVAQPQPVNPAVAAANAKQRQHLKQLEQQLEHCIETLWTGSVLLEDMTSTAAPQFQKKVNDLVDDLKALETLSHVLDARVPLPLIEVVDAGGNPDTLTRTMLSAARARNEDMRGKLQETKLLRAHLEARQKAWTGAAPLSTDTPAPAASPSSSPASSSLSATSYRFEAKASASPSVQHQQQSGAIAAMQT